MDIVKKPEYRAVLDVVKNHITDLAYPTIFLSFISVAAIIFLQILYLDNYLPYWLHLIITSYLLYLIYTPFHEATHGNISSKYKWLNRLFGSLSAFFYLHSFTQHKWSHLTHHKYANDPILDPDGLIQGKNLFTTIIKSFFLSLTKDLIYFQRKEVKNAPGTKKIIYIGILESIIPIAFIIFLTNALSLPWHHFILSYVLPLLFATIILGVFFDYLVHRPHKSTERFGDTNVIRTKSKLDDVMTYIWVYQNYHGMHHLFPKLPFYNYKKVFVESEKELESLGLPIITLGKD